MTAFDEEDTDAARAARNGLAQSIGTGGILMYACTTREDTVDPDVIEVGEDYILFSGVPPEIQYHES